MSLPPHPAGPPHPADANETVAAPMSKRSRLLIALVVFAVVVVVALHLTGVIGSG